MATLQSDHVVRTLERLQARIEARFPQSGLHAVAGDLVIEARSTAKRAEAITRPYPLTRLLVALVVVGLASTAAMVWIYGGGPGLNHLTDLAGASRAVVDVNPLTLISGLEAVVNLAILGALAIWFLINSEARAKRGRALAALHGLRAFAHVVDMHQLTKDPTVVLAQGPQTSVSPARSMDQFQLTRYLDYCAELLALIGKLAALYGARTQDSAVIAAVNDIESLCSDLGRKIWQKITILSALDERSGPRQAT